MSVLKQAMNTAATAKADTEKRFAFLYEATKELLAHPDMSVFRNLKDTQEPFNNALSFQCEFTNGYEHNNYAVELRSRHALITFKTDYDFILLNGNNARNGITSTVPTERDLEHQDIAAIFVRLSEIDPIFGERFARAVESYKDPERAPKKSIPDPPNAPRGKHLNL